MIEVLGALHHSVLVEDSVLTQGTINSTSQARLGGRWVNRAILVPLVEQRYHIVTCAELCHFGTNADDLASTIGTGNHRKVEGEGVESLWNGSIN